MLKTRILTALVAIPVALFSAWQGGFLFAGVICILAVVGWREFYKMLPIQTKPNLLQYMGMLFSVAIILGAQFNIFFLANNVLWLGSTIAFLATIFVLRDCQAMPAIFYSIAGISYLGVGFSQFVKVRNWDGFLGVTDGGLIILATVVVATWMNDSFAYFVGRAVGKHKLCPEISPAKSWEGAIAGLCGAVLTVFGFVYHFGLPLSGIAAISLGLVVGVSGILGDLAESGLKRWSGIKDSGNFFPGHGGVLDRLDSLLLVLPVTYLWLWLWLFSQMSR